MQRSGKNTKYIFITGGVISSLGKGIAASSIGALMESRGLKITLLKMDPYINVDPGTMSPYQHGEVFVTDDGAETDMDLGHYERFTHSRMTRDNNFTTGQVYDAVISKERRGDYLGKTVQVIPHVTDEIQAMIRQAAHDVDLVIVEVGGTVGDIESLPFLEAIRQMRLELGHQNSVAIHLTLVPYIAPAGELKSKPTQHSVQKLREIGIQPEILLCRTDRPLPQGVKDKISLFCNVDPNAVIEMQDVKTIYEVPLALERERLDDLIAQRLNIWSRGAELTHWQRIVDLVRKPDGEVHIGMVGKYVELQESYKSLNEALRHGGFGNRVRVELHFIDSGRIEEEPDSVSELLGLDGVLVPGGFGERGVEGKVAAIRFARERGIPFFGICLGLQLMIIEFARNVLGFGEANSTEFQEDTPHPVIALLEEQEGVEEMGATMRLGAFPCVLQGGTLAHRTYGAERISERHRHRYEVNGSFIQKLEAGGLVLSGRSPDGTLVEMAELPEHPWYLGCQFHPEFKSRPTDPHPLFVGFIQAALRNRRRRESGAREGAPAAQAEGAKG